MTAKYGFSAVREALVEDLKGAYPTKWEDFKAARVLGEDVFGSPKPHPNAVLNLFLEQNIKFAAPFAAYRACLGGFPALVSDGPGTLLPRLTLASITHGMGLTLRMLTHAVYNIVHLRDLGVCPDRLCILNVGANPTGRRREALEKVSHVMFGGIEDDMLYPGPPNIGGEVGSSGRRKCSDVSFGVRPKSVRTGTNLPVRYQICSDKCQKIAKNRQKQSRDGLGCKTCTRLS